MKQIQFSDLTPTQQTLVYKAIEMREFAYAEYSKFKVGAALIDINQNIHTGCNVESADYTLTTHAEMLAIDSMVKSGCTEMMEIAIALSSPSGDSVPCGLCRQKMTEFSINPMIIGINLLPNNDIKSIVTYSLDELLPFAFKKSSL